MAQPKLEPQIVGEFRTFDDWVNNATRHLTGVTGSCGENLSAICVDSRGRRMNIGKDFMQARDEGTFPVFYFWHCKPQRKGKR